MDAFLTGIYIALSIVGLALIIFSPIAFVYFLAKNNMFFTIVKEGQAKAIMKFGKFKKIIMCYQGYGVNEEWKVCQRVTDTREPHPNGIHGVIKIIKNSNDKNSNNEPTVICNLRPEPLKIGGLMWVGIPFIYSVYKYEFRWISFEQKEEGGKLIEKTIAHEETLDYILVQDDVFYSFLRGADSKELVPVDMELLLTIRIINPYKAIFRVQNWLEAVQNQTKPALRGFAASKKYKDLIGKKEEVRREADEFLKDSGIDNYVEENYGTRLKRVGLVSIDLSGERGEAYLAASTKQYEADREKERIETIANAEVGRINKIYSEITRHGSEGLFIRANEAIEEAGKGPSNLVVFPLESAKSMLESWTGGSMKKAKGKEEK